MDGDQHIDSDGGTKNLFDKLKTLHPWRIAALAVIGLVALFVVYSLLASLLSTSTGLTSKSYSYPESVSNEMGYGGGYAAGGAAGYAPTLGTRNIAPSPEPRPPYEEEYSTGDDAEAYEVREYHVHYEARTLSATCERIESLKPLPHVIFESANAGEHSCYYRFKVESDRTDEVLATLEELDPKELSQSTETIKRQLDDFMSRIDILTSSLVAIEETLADAQDAYDELSALATREGDSESLAVAIKAKLDLISQLRRERESVRNQLDQLNRAKAERLDRLAYSFFTVRVTEFTFIDFESLGDSWKRALQEFATDVNDLLQAFTLGLVTFVLWGLLLAVYLLIGLLVVKYGWRLVRALWRM